MSEPYYKLVIEQAPLPIRPATLKIADPLPFVAPVRPRTIAPKPITRAERMEIGDDVALARSEGFEFGPPATLGECPEGPCPHFSCRHHAGIEVNEKTGAIKINFPGVEPQDLVETCTLRAAARVSDQHASGTEESGAAMGLEDVGRILNLTRERVRQIQDRAVDKLRRRLDIESFEAFTPPTQPLPAPADHGVDLALDPDVLAARRVRAFVARANAIRFRPCGICGGPVLVTTLRRRRYLHRAGCPGYTQQNRRLLIKSRWALLNGLCVRCFHRPICGGTKYCERCRAANNGDSKRMYDLRKKAAVCVRCGTAPAATDRLSCEACLARYRDRYADRKVTPEVAVG